ncbi:MAG TPA: carbohydrate ABC transporter permease [Phototrophicaceae bacterium]|nr:carbohydrate ABC transporter permease [Phototrophicaceae bacterium]
MSEQADQPAPYTDLSLPIKVLTYFVLILGAVVMVLPFVWMASTACKVPAELNTLPVRWIPQTPVCRENLNLLYETSPNFNRYLLNSALLTIGRLVGQLVTCSLAAYGFARFKFPGRNVIFALSLGLLMVPFQAILIPEYLLLRQLDWLNSFRALIIPGAFSAFAMFLLRQAFLQIPLELEESAMIDGANPLQVLRYITLPLSGPALAAFAVITIQAAWNDFLFPLVVANTPDTRVVTIGISLLQGERSTPWNLLMMGSFLATMPMLILFVILQRYFIEGVTMSGIKG